MVPATDGKLHTALGREGKNDQENPGIQKTQKRDLLVVQWLSRALKALASSQARTSRGPDAWVSGGAAGWLRSTRKGRAGCARMLLIFFTSSSLTSSMCCISSAGVRRSDPRHLTEGSPPPPPPDGVRAAGVQGPHPSPSLFPAKLGGSLWVGLAGPQDF